MPDDPDSLWSQLKKRFQEANRLARREKNVPSDTIKRGQNLSVFFGNDEIGSFDPELAVILQNMQDQGGIDIKAPSIAKNTNISLAMLYGDLLPAMVKRQWIEEKTETFQLGGLDTRRKTYSIRPGFRVVPKEDSALKISHSTLDNDGGH